MRIARAALCPRCGAAVMVGDDADRMAARAQVDPVPLDARGELVALLQGRSTYTLRYGAQGYAIDYRAAVDIQGGPPGAYTDRDVVADHRCGMPLPCAETSYLKNPAQPAGNVLPLDPPF